MGAIKEWLRASKARDALAFFPGAAASSVELRIVGRTLLHAALVGAAAGLVGAAFFAGLEWVQRLLLEDVGGYHPLRAAGENFLAESTHPHHFRPWLLALLPALGALGSGIVSQLAPETRGGGGDAMIDAFHHKDGMIRRRVIWVKALASLLTLGSGGAGGREGPTMQIGGALGSTVGRLLRVGTAERRVLMIAGVAAGIAAVFRTPLGAALLAVEVLYHDDFESDALIPAVLASVVAYSVVISIYGESTLFSQPSRFPFVPAHLWLYGLMAMLVALMANVFLRTLRTVQGISKRLPLPGWAKPAAGGLALGIFAVPLVALVGWQIGQPGQGLGLLGGGYGAVQLAISGASFLPGGWAAVALFGGLCLAKLFASSLTIGTGGSAGDFAPALVIGGLFGGAFGRAVQLLSNDPRINPAAFALIAMGTFYGGLAHAPLSSLIIVCELAGSYDLLVPLMLAEGIAFIALRKRSLYHAQLPSRRYSPAHRDDSGLHPAIVPKVSGPPLPGPTPPPPPTSDTSASSEATATAVTTGPQPGDSQVSST
ncbi:MAG TPA: chloride channel protein [Polyangia bacterium]